MNDFGEGKWIKTRKESKCECCFGLIAKGENVFHYKGRYDGEWCDYKLHSECYDGIAEYGEWEFMPGEGPVPDRLAATA